MPQLGIYHDDSIYWVTAKSLASGAGYRIESLPGQPHQTKYPPMLPALLALVWRLAPEFPANLRWAALLAWMWLPLLLAAARKLYQDYGLGWWTGWILCAAIALNLVAATFSTLLMTELMFSTLLLAALILAERASRPGSPRWLGALAGIIGGVAFLTRTAAGVLLLTAPLVFAVRRQYRQAMLFLAGMIPAVFGWQVWCLARRAPSGDMMTLYYTDYFGFHLANVTWEQLPSWVGQNAAALVAGLGELLLFDDSGNFWLHQLTRLFAFAGIAGAIRLAWRTSQWHYPAYAVAFCLQAVLWHFPPRDRLVLPLLPLLLAGFWTEMSHLAGIVAAAWRRRKPGDRVAAAMTAAAMCALVAAIAWRTHYALAQFVPEIFAQHRQALADNLAAYRWLASNSPQDSRVLAYDDPLMYLYTGRRAASWRIPPKYAYNSDSTGMTRHVAAMPGYARSAQLGWVLFTSGDYRLDSYAVGQRALRGVLGADPAFHLAYQHGQAAVYRIEAQ